MTPKVWYSTATSNRAKWKIFVMAGLASSAFRFGASVWPLGICTTSALPSPGESCTTQSRSRCGFSPMVSVSIATALV